MRILARQDVERALSMHQAIEAVKTGFAQLSTGRADVPVRTALEVPRHDGVSLIMPAYLPDDDAVAVKIVSVFNENPERGLPLIHALVVVLDAKTGAPEALMDGTYLTALRTGAASGAATDLLAREDVQVAAVIGAGTQGRTQLEAVCAVRPIQEAWVYDVHADKAQEWATEMSMRLELPVRAAATPAQAVARADVICTATTASTPVFDDADVRPGTHINAVGAYTPEMQEIPPETILRALVVVDHYESAMAEAGDLLIPIEKGLITRDHIHAELGAILSGASPGRESEEQITLFKTVGVAVEDVAVARAVLDAARTMELGTHFAL